jgi:hypothetical protein
MIPRIAPSSCDPCFFVDTGNVDAAMPGSRHPSPASVPSSAVGADMSQAAAAVLRTSEDNALTGRGAADVAGALTSNPDQ